MSNPTLASITAELEAVETAARGRGSLTCDHLAGRIANIRGELQQIAQPQPPAEAQPVAWCPACNGAGWVPDSIDAEPVTCPDCAGSGSAEHSITVNEPPSAPVGVEAEARHLLAHEYAVKLGTERAAKVLGGPWTMEEDAELRAISAALAQQPADCPHRERCECIGACKHGMSGSGATEAAAAQQPPAEAQPVADESPGDLLPCPFCGSPAERIDFGPGDAENEGGSCIACTQCQSSGPVEFGRKENLVSNWNRLTAPSAPVGVEDLSCCGGNDETPKSHCMDCSRYPGLIAQQPAAREAEPKLDAHDPASGELAAQWLHRNGLRELAAVVRAQLDMRAQEPAAEINEPFGISEQLRAAATRSYVDGVGWCWMQDGEIIEVCE